MPTKHEISAGVYILLYIILYYVITTLVSSASPNDGHVCPSFIIALIKIVSELQVLSLSVR